MRADTREGRWGFGNRGIGGSTSRLRVSLDKLRGLGVSGPKIGNQVCRCHQMCPNLGTIPAASSLQSGAGTGGGGWVWLGGRCWWDVKGQRVIGFSLLQAGGQLHMNNISFGSREAIVQVAWEVQGEGVKERCNRSAVDWPS